MHVNKCQNLSARVSMCQHLSAHVSTCQHVSVRVSTGSFGKQTEPVHGRKLVQTYIKLLKHIRARFVPNFFGIFKNLFLFLCLFWFWCREKTENSALGSACEEDSVVEKNNKITKIKQTNLRDKHDIQDSRIEGYCKCLPLKLFYIIDPTYWRKISMIK